jgi:uncharacterized protein DUF3800
MAMLYFYCDESGKYRKNPVIAITGIGADSKHLETFQAEWTLLLRSYGLLPELHMSRVLDLKQANGPKMPADQTLDERTDALLPFADCINKYLEIGLMQAWDIKGYNNLPTEVKKLLGGSSDPYQLAFVRGLLEIADYVGKDGTISVICDDDEVISWDTYNHYRAIRKAVPEINPSFAGITFAKSEHFIPLQAADMAAFLARREAAERFWGKPNEYKRLTNYLVGRPREQSRGTMRWFTLFADESGLVELANDIMKEKANEHRKLSP